MDMKLGKITPEEAMWLDRLYLRANETDDWAPVKKYYKKLATKYNFNEEKVSITKNGDILELAICYKCGEIATTPNGTNYVYDDEISEEIFAVCQPCHEKYFPEKEYRERLYSEDV